LKQPSAAGVFENHLQERTKQSMKPSRKSVVLTAALAGLLGGTMNRVSAAPHDPQDTGKSDAGKKTKAEKHACAGKNSCKGKGGCAPDGSKDNKAAAAGVTEKHACKGQNSCKGNGGCATDGKKH
jgi:hypothetical protein